MELPALRFGVQGNSYCSRISAAEKLQGDPTHLTSGGGWEIFRSDY